MVKLIVEPNEVIKEDVLFDNIALSLSEHKDLKKVLLIPPDMTRANSYGGKITNIYYNILTQNGTEVQILPALGTHYAMTREEQLKFFGDIPEDVFLIHRWREDIQKIGEVSSEFVSDVSEGLFTEKIDVCINKVLLDKSIDLIISIGQVVPHEVVGMANYSKNIFVGCGGGDIINKSHMLGAVYGMERVMGKDFSPVRKVFDYAETNFINDLPLMYVLTVTTTEEEVTDLRGLYIGRDRYLFERAVAQSQKLNLNYLDKAPKKVVVYLDGEEFKSTWLGNKAIYRTRMAIADGGELIILAPGVKQFGEDAKNNELIAKYGYVGRLKVFELLKANKDLQDNQSVAAHLIHGSSDDRFKIFYAAKNMTEAEINSVNYGYLDYETESKKYANCTDGFNIVDGEEIYYISNPALGLWALEEK